MAMSAKAYQNVLVAVDLGSDDEYLIESALNVVADPAKLTVMSVIEPMVYPADIATAALPAMLREQRQEQAEATLAELAKTYGLPEGAHRVAYGRPATEIHKAAQALNTDLIVVGSHGRHGVQLLLGSTSNAVLHGAGCDVLAVRVSTD